MKRLLPLVLATLTCFYFNAATIIVTNTNDSGAGSFRQAVANANMGDIIRFDPSLIAGGSDTILFATPVNITKGLFIKGVYNSTDTLYFSGGGLSRMIDITMASSSTFGNVDMDSLVFINGYSTEGGALKYTSDYNANARLYLRHCVFRDNSSDIGGAIYSYKTSGGTGSNYTCNVTLEYSTFKNNTSSYSGAGNAGGGAIYIYRYSSTIGYAVAINMEITGCNFLNNTASARGGAVYAYVYAYGPPSTGVSNIEVTSSSFIGNEATHYGGALYSYSFGNTECEVHSYISTWAGNTTIGSGGACYLESTAHNTFFETNFSTFYGNTAFVDGSGLYLKSDETDGISRIESFGSIFAANGGNVNYQNTIYQSASSNLDAPFSSGCYNLFDFPQNHLQYYQEYIPNASDDFNQTLAQINLAPVALNQNGTYTRVPMTGSVAINAYPWSGGEAQNRPVLGLRDIGAAESDICSTIPVSQTASICQGSFYNFYDQIITDAGTYTHTIVTPGQCDSLVTLTLSTTATVAPTISITANPGNTIMTGTSVTITANYTGGGTAPSFQWYANGSPIGPNAPSVVSSTLFNGAQISCEITSNAGCVSPSSVTSNIITFTVHANNDEACNAIPLGVNTTCVTQYFANHIATNSTNVGAHTCANSTSKDIWFKFTAPASGNVEIYTYAGTLLDAVMSVYLGPTCSSLFEAGCVDDDGTNQMPQGMVTGATPGSTYYIRVSSFGTTASGNFGICVVDAGSTPVAPVIVSNDTDNNLCEGASLILTSDAATGNVWSTGATTQSITVSNAGTYTVTVNSMTSNQIIVTTTSINGTVTDNGSGTLTAGEAATGGVTYQWIDCNNGNASVPGATNRDFSPSVNGSYAVTITKNGCTETSSCVIFDDIASLAALSGSHAFSLYPNPNEGTFNIDFSYGTARTIKVYNTLGALVHEQLCTSTNAEVQLKNVEIGLYLVEITEGASVKLEKITVNR